MNMDWQNIKGHEQIKSELSRLLSMNRLPHALLFTGEEGIGKAMAARLLAKALLCCAEGNSRPCGICPSCRSFDEGSHPDFFYLQPESSGSVKMIKIEQMRQVQAALALSPYLSERRAVIIDGAEYMNDTVANSLLKTLEEPQGEIYFILVTANKDKLLPTVLSRCTKIYFAPLRNEEVAAILRDKGGVDTDRAEVIARISGGSAGRALAFIDSGALDLRRKAAAILSGSLSDQQIIDISAELSALDRSLIRQWASFIRQLLRDAMLLSAGAAPEMLCNSDMQAELADAVQLSKSRLLKKIELSLQLMQRLNSNADARLIIQNFLLQWRTL